MAEAISIIVAVAIMIAIPIGIVRGLSGGIQHGSSKGSIISSSMLEMDRLMRPSTGHIVQAEEEMKQHADGIGGE